MIDIRPVAKKAAKPVTSRVDRFLEAMVEQIHAAKQEILDEMAAGEARQAERHFTLAARITALENRIDSDS